MKLRACSSLLTLVPFLYLLRLLALATLAAGLPGNGRAETRLLRVSAVQSWAPPYAQFREGSLVGGISHDIIQALAETLGLGVQIQVLPRTRIDAAVAAGEIDLRCHISSDWLRGNKDAYAWGPPLFELATVLSGHESTAPVYTLDQLNRGQSIGTVLGFVYPGLEERFADGRLRRDDTFAVDRNLQKLKFNRSPYVVADTRELEWHQRNNPGHQFAAWRLPITRTDYRCAVPRNGRFEAGPLLQALERLLAEGQINRILKAHGPPQPVVVMSAQYPARQLNRQQVTALFLGDMQELPGGGRPLLAALGGEVREEFFKRVLDKDTAQVKAIWSRMTFSGRGRPPREFSSTAALRAWLALHPNALAYLDSSSLDPSVRIVYAPELGAP